MGLANGVHHLALNVRHVEPALEFFTQACGMELKAFYWMHGVDKAYHIFLKLSDFEYVALVRNPEDDDILPSKEHTWELVGSGSRIQGAMQHVSFNVDSYDDLMAMMDRIRSYGYQVLGPVDHGFHWSIYIPSVCDGALIEFSSSEGPINPDVWILQDTVDHAGIGEEQMKRYMSPPAFASKSGTVPQPERDNNKQPGLDGQVIGVVLSDPDAMAAAIGQMKETYEQQMGDS